MEYFKPVGMHEIDAVIEIYQRATENMERMGIHQWDEVYPDRDTISGDIASGTMHGFYIDDVLCAIQVINEIQPPEYAAVDWKYNDDRPLILHRLCVNPSAQNKGISRKMIHYAEDYAVNHGYRCIRFDAFIENPIAGAIYRKEGYIESGIVRFRKGDFYCFEKKVFHC